MASAQSSHATAPPPPPLARKPTESPAPSVVSASIVAGLARLPVLAFAITTADGRAVSRVCPFLIIEMVTDGLDCAATRARYVTGDAAEPPGTSSFSTVSALPPTSSSGPNQSSPEPLPSRSMLAWSTSTNRRSSIWPTTVASDQSGKAPPPIRWGIGASTRRK